MNRPSSGRTSSTSTNSSDTIQFQEIVAIVRLHLFSSILIVFLATAFAITIAYLLPKKFTSTAILNIQAAYFQVPLVGDLIATNDSAEYKAQRESLLRYALSDEFLDQLGDKYHAFRYLPTDRMHVLERSNLLSRIEYFSLGSNSYQISVHAHTADDAYGMTKAVLDQMISTLVSERMSKLLQTRTAIQGNLQALKQDMAAAPRSDDARLSDTSESLDDAMAKLSSLERRFTMQHPLVIEQLQRVRILQERQHRNKELTDADQHVSESLSGSHRALEDLYDDLLRKFNYLDIVIDMEKTKGNYTYLSILQQPEIPTSPVFPKKIGFAIGGLVLGVVFALLTMIFKELSRGTFANPASAAQVLEAPYLGSLPSWKMLDYKTKALPAPEPRTPG